MIASAPRLRAAPPFMVAAGLLLWGWQNQFLVYALPMALAIESSRWAAWRWPVSDREFNLLADVSSVIFAIVVVYVFNSRGATGIFVILALTPFVFFPLLLVQSYSETGRVRLSSLFISMRRLDPRLSPEAGAEIDLSLPYFCSCLISASAGNQRPQEFFMLAAALLALLLWSVRPRRYSPAIWLGCAALAIALGWLGQAGLVRMQMEMESSMMQIFDRFLWRYRDPNRATTAIGSIGRIKLSDRIVLRLKTPRPLSAPMLLREASYDSYNYGIWSNRDYAFTGVDPDVTGNVFALSPAAAHEQVVLSTYLTEDSGVVPLPLGATLIRDSSATAVARNSHGAVRVEAKEGWLRYTVGIGDRPDPDASPTDRDLQIADSYRGDFDRLAAQLGLTRRSPAEAVAAVRAFFANGFTYSLTQRHRYPRGRYLSEFLFETRSGHCEFFATATALLLRAGGVPARYAVGYSIDEFSPLEDQYVGRARHSHSWAEAWVNGAWRPVDTTPAVWAPLEDNQASAFEGLFDLWSWASFRYARWSGSDASETDRDYTPLLWLLIPLVGLLGWRLYFKERVSLRRAAGEMRRERARAGGDSGFYAVIAALERDGHTRHAGETVSAWAARLQDRIGLTSLRDAAALHYRCRFDPEGLSAEDRRRLDVGVEGALREIAEHSPRSVAPARAGTEA